MIASIKNSDKAEIPTLAEFISSQSTDAGCRAAFASIRKASTRFNVYSNKVLFEGFPLEGRTQRVVPASLYPRFFHLCRYPLLDSYNGDWQMYYFLTKEL